MAPHPASPRSARAEPRPTAAFPSALTEIATFSIAATTTATLSTLHTHTLIRCRTQTTPVRPTTTPTLRTMTPTTKEGPPYLIAVDQEPAPTSRPSRMYPRLTPLLRNRKMFLPTRSLRRRQRFRSEEHTSELQSHVK